MVYRFFVFSSILISNMLFSIGSDVPTVVDFQNFKYFQENLLYDKAHSWTWNLGDAAFELGYTAFNDSPEIGTFVSRLQQDYKIDVAVETGVYLGATTRFLSMLFEQVHAIEAVKPIYDAAKERLGKYPNIHCYLGGSEKILKEILSSLKNKRILFYLDAHGGGYDYWPILDELEHISKTHQDNCIVMIDDFYVPGTNIHGASDGHHELSHEFIRTKLEKVFNGYNFYYLIPKDRSRSAKFVAIPMHWK